MGRKRRKRKEDRKVLNFELKVFWILRVIKLVFFLFLSFYLKDSKFSIIKRKISFFRFVLFLFLFLSFKYVF